MRSRINLRRLLFRSIAVTIALAMAWPALSAPIPQPDLIMVDCDCWKEGGKSKCQGKVKNQGNFGTVYQFSVKYTLCGGGASTQNKYFTVGPLPAGVTSANLYWELSGTVWTCCYMYADNFNIIAESNEANNSYNENNFHVFIDPGQTIDFGGCVIFNPLEDAIEVNQTLLNVPLDWTATVYPTMVLLPPDSVCYLTLEVTAPDPITTYPTIVIQSESQTGELTQYNTVTVSSAIPTLTEWGMIIFGVVLLGFITWVFLRRRRAVVSLR